jgi:hypothetical protein
MTAMNSEPEFALTGQPDRPAEPAPELERTDEAARRRSPPENTSSANLLFCFQCGAPNDGAEFCPKCGAMRCATCGQ